MAHRWAEKTEKGNARCEKCKLIRVFEGTSRMRNGADINIYSYKRGNRYVPGAGILENKVPPCPGEQP